MKRVKLYEDFISEANKGKVHRAAKKGSYPAVVVVVQDGKVIHQEPVSTPEVAPATFNVMQEKYPKALIHLEDKTGKRLFSESVVTEAKNTIGLAFKSEDDYNGFVEFIEDEGGKIFKNIGWDHKTKSWEVIMDTSVLDDIYGEGHPGNKESGWYGALPTDFESVIIEGFVSEAFIGPFVFNDTMSDEELKAMYDGALDGYANWQKGFHHPKAKYKQAYQEIEKLLKKRGVEESIVTEGKVLLADLPQKLHDADKADWGSIVKTPYIDGNSITVLVHAGDSSVKKYLNDLIKGFGFKTKFDEVAREGSIHYYTWILLNVDESVVKEGYDGNWSDFKYEFPMRFEEETGNSPKAIKKLAKKGNGYEVRTSTHMSQTEMEKVGLALGLKLKSYTKDSIIAISVYESVVTEAFKSSYVTKQGSDYVVARFLDKPTNQRAIDSLVKDLRKKQKEVLGKDPGGGFSMDLDTIYSGGFSKKEADELLKSLDESVVTEGNIKYKKGKTYQSEGPWTVVVDSNSSGLDISVNNSAGWRLDPQDEREETFQLLDGGRQRATLTFKEGNIDAFAKKMFDLNDRTTHGEKEGLTAKDYADIIRVWIDMRMANEAIVTEAKDNLYLQLHKKYAESIKGLKAKKIKKLTDLVSVQRWSMEDREDYLDMDPKKKKELSAEYDEERKLFKKYTAGDDSVMLPKGTETLAESIVTEASQEAYTLHRLADNPGEAVADEFLSKHNVDFKLLTKAIQQGTINKYDLRDIVNGSAQASKMKKFIKDFVTESLIIKL